MSMRVPQCDDRGVRFTVDPATVAWRYARRIWFRRGAVQRQRLTAAQAVRGDEA